MKTVVAVRHCTTPWNRISRVQGHTDIDIDEGGALEARELASKLADLGLEVIVTSDLTRALSTAKIIGKMLRLEIIVDSRLRECQFGSVEGMIHNDAVKLHGEHLFNGWMKANTKPYTFKHLGGESEIEVISRHIELLDEVKTNYFEDTILLVGHGRSLNTLLKHLGVDIEKNLLNRGEYRKFEY